MVYMRILLQNTQSHILSTYGDDSGGTQWHSCRLLGPLEYYVSFPNRETLIQTSTYYDPYYGDPQKGTLYLNP